MLWVRFGAADILGATNRASLAARFMLAFAGLGINSCPSPWNVSRRVSATGDPGDDILYEETTWLKPLMIFP